MGFFDSFSSNGGGLLGGLDDPRQAGQMALAMGLLSASGPSTTPTSFGQAFGKAGLQGMQAYQGAIDAGIKRQEGQQMADYRKAQMDQFNQKTAGMKSQQDAIGALRTKLGADPSYKPSAADLIDIDPEHAFKMLSGGAVDHGLEPKIGLHPETNKLTYFVQDKSGNTKWLGAGVPDSLQFIPGGDYRPPQVFDKRNGTVTTPGGAGGMPPGLPPLPVSQSAGQTQPAFGTTPAGQDAEPVDNLAPWSALRSPKEQDQMRSRAYEMENKKLDFLREKIAGAQPVMTDLERFGELNRNTGTGGAIDRIPFMPSFFDDKREMEAIQSRLGPSQRAPGSGASSDRDVKLFLSGIPSTNQPGAVNKAIRDQFQKQLDDTRNELALKEKYLLEKGHLNGANEQFTAAMQRGKSGGLDTSKLTPEQAAFLQQQDPAAFAQGVDRFKKNNPGQKQNAPAKPAKSTPSQPVMDSKPIANASNNGKTIVEHDTGKKYRSNGLQWVEVQ